MRAAVAVGAVAGLVGLSALAALGGRTLGEASLRFDGDAGGPVAAAPAAGPLPASSKRSADEQFPTSAVASDASGYERVAPREPLSKLSLALPPEPEVSDDVEGTILHRAVASSAGVLEAEGRMVMVAGIDIVPSGEHCTHEGRSWNCGLRARTAFRALLRGRSPTCAIPPDAEGETVEARCRIGTRDLGEWLVSNGWARAAAGGRYVEAEAAAREKRLGIFGPPPDTTPVLALPDAPAATPSIEFIGPSDASTPPILRQEPSG